MSLISFIPDWYKDGFKELSLMNDEDFYLLKDGLSLTSLVASIGILAKKIADMKNLESDTLQDIFESVGSLVGVDKTNEIVEDLTC